MRDAVHVPKIVDVIKHKDARIGQINFVAFSKVHACCGVCGFLLFLHLSSLNAVKTMEKRF